MIGWLRRRRQRRIQGEMAINNVVYLEQVNEKLARDNARQRTRLMQAESDLERVQNAEMVQRRRAAACFAILDRVAPRDHTEANELRTIMRMGNDDLARGVLTRHGGGLIPGEGPIGNALTGRALEHWHRAVSINPGFLAPYDPQLGYRTRYTAPVAPHRDTSQGGGGDALMGAVIGGYVGDAAVHTSISPSIDVCTGDGGSSASCGGGEGS